MAWEAKCDECEKPITHEDVIYELRVCDRRGSAMVTYTFHWKCALAWLRKEQSGR